MRLHVVTSDGKYIGSYIGKSIPLSVKKAYPGSYSVPKPPPHIDAVWDGDKWDISTSILVTKDEAKQQLNDLIDEVIEHLIKEYPKRERESWPTKYREAELFLVDQKYPALTIKAEAKARGIDPITLAKKIVKKTTKMAILYGTISGIRNKIESDIDSISDSIRY